MRLRKDVVQVLLKLKSGERIVGEGVAGARFNQGLVCCEP